MMIMKKYAQLFTLTLGASLFFFNGFLNAAFEEILYTSVFDFGQKEEFHDSTTTKEECVKNRLREQILRDITAEHGTQLKDLLTANKEAKKDDENLLKTVNWFQDSEVEKIEDTTASEQVQKSSMFVPARLGKVALLYSKKGFYVVKDGKIHQVKNHLLDRSLRNISKDSVKLKKFLKTGYISVNQDENGDYLLEVTDRVKGGGIFGANAGFWAGKFLTHFVGHGVICIVGALTGPAAPATIAALEATFAGPIEAASNAVGVGTGILGGVATGPV